MTPNRLWILATLMLAAWVYAARIAHADDLVEEAAEPVASDKPDAWAALGQDVRVRKVVVADFDGKGALRLRQAVLDALSEHTEVEVVGANDVEVSAKGRSIRDRKARAALSSELNIYAWVDHDEDSGSIKLSDAEGAELAELSGVVEHGGSESELRTKIWSALGPHVSDQGLRMHLLEQLRASAGSKLEAADEERVRQSEIALRRAQMRAEHLAASKQRAASVLQAQQAERSRQQELALARVEREQAEQAKQAELARQAELAQQMELARQQQAATAKQAPPPSQAPQQPVHDVYPADDGGAWQPGRTQPVFVQPSQPVEPAYAEPAYAEQPDYAAPPQPAPAEPTSSAAMPVSEATQQWLERRRQQRAEQQR